MACRKNTPSWARYKNNKRLKRRYIKHVSPIRGGTVKRKDILAPRVFSLLRNRSSVIEYIDGIMKHAKSKEYVTMNISEVTDTDPLTVSLLIAIMMDKRIKARMSFAKYVSIRIPTGDSGPAAMFRKCDFHRIVTSGSSDSNYFMSRVDTSINRRIIKEVLKLAEKKNIEGARSNLSPILVEIMSNTNNHAGLSDDRDDEYPWHLSIIEEENKICFSVIDLGVGIYESLKTNEALRNIPKEEWSAVNNIYENEQSRYLATNIPKGVYSSTKLNFRGKGLREIYIRANRTASIGEFVIITNKARVDVLNIEKQNIDSGCSFRGTAYYWEMAKSE